MCKVDTCGQPDEDIAQPPPLWIVRGKGGKSRLVGEDQVSREDGKHVREARQLGEEHFRKDHYRHEDLYAAERMDWKRKWTEDQAEEERLRKKAKEDMEKEDE